MRWKMHALCLLTLLLCGLRAVSQARYTLQAIASPNGASITPLGLNNKGHVAGLFFTGLSNDPFFPKRHPFFWTPETGTQDLGSLGGYFAEGRGINDSDQIVGWSDNLPDPDPGFGVQIGFLWDPVHGFTTLNRPDDFVVYGHGLNNLGQAVGAFRIGNPVLDFPYHAFLWDTTGGLQDLGSPDGFLTSDASGINDAGQVVGTLYSDFYFGTVLGFLWDSVNGYRTLAPLDPTMYCAAGAINASGKIIGAAGLLDPLFFFQTSHAVCWTDPNTIQDLGTLNFGFVSGANGINTAGKIVGYSGSTSVAWDGQQVNHGVLWNSVTDLQDLNPQIPVTRGYYLSSATAINDQGQIAGVLSANNRFFPDRAVLLTPAPPPTAFASDVTSQIKVQRGGFRRQIPYSVFVQRVTLTNTSKHKITGPLSLALDGMSDFVSSAYPDGYTNYLAPLYSPYINVNLGAGNTLAPGKSVFVDVALAADSTALDFYANLHYHARLLAGAGAR